VGNALALSTCPQAFLVLIYQFVGKVVSCRARSTVGITSQVRNHLW
jgi:hypothetical protein